MGPAGACLNEEPLPLLDTLPVLVTTKGQLRTQS